MDGFSNHDIARMQQAAAEAREMHRRARPAAEPEPLRRSGWPQQTPPRQNRPNRAEPLRQNTAPAAEGPCADLHRQQDAPPEAEKSAAVPEAATSADLPGALTRVMDALGMDNERLLLLVLALLLWNEKADRTLILALLYLLF